MRQNPGAVHNAFGVTHVSCSHSSLEGVLHLFAGLLEVALDLVALAFCFEVVVSNQLARSLPDLACQVFGGILCFIGGSHIRAFRGSRTSEHVSVAGKGHEVSCGVQAT